MDEALAMWRVLGDRREIALALEGIGWAQLLNATMKRATTPSKRAWNSFDRLAIPTG
jgi:hypothetical protein